VELLLFVAASIVLGVLAYFFGYDSRNGIQSDEERLAARGMRWDRPGRLPQG
jgi:hypothetical protein